MTNKNFLIKNGLSIGADNEVISSARAASLTSATITGDLTVDTSTLKVDSSNNKVGIGTTSPGKNLEVNDSATPTIRFGRSNSYYWDVGHTLSQFQFNSETGGTIMQLEYDGNVGINTTSPNEKLEVAGNLTLTPSAKNNSPSSGAAISDIKFVGRTDNSVVAKIGAIHNDNLNGTDGQILFYTADNTASAVASEKMRILSSGGITFNGDTATANALDDYEEGIHVATITCGTSGTVTLNGAYSDLSYTKVGRLVTVTGFIIVSSVSSPVGYYTISLPFTAANLTDRAADSCVSIMHHYGNNAKPSDIVAFLPEGSSILYVYRGDVGVTRSETSAQELRASTQIMLTVSYNVA